MPLEECCPDRGRGIWVLAAVTVGGGLGGIIGMLLAVPVTATLYKLLQKDVQKRKAALQPETEAPGTARIRIVQANL